MSASNRSSSASSPSPAKRGTTAASTEAKPQEASPPSHPLTPLVTALNAVLPPGWERWALVGAIRWLRRAVIISTTALAANLVLSGLVDALLASRASQPGAAVAGVDVLGEFLTMVLAGKLERPVAAVKRAWAPLIALCFFRDHFAIGAALSGIHSLTQRSTTTPMLRQHALNAFLVCLYALAVRINAAT